MLTESITIEATREEILGGPLLKKIIETSLNLKQLTSKVGKCVSWSLSKTIRNYLTTMLEDLLHKESVHSKYQNSPQEETEVYDILNVEKSLRYADINGNIHHNCLGLSYDMTCVGLSVKLTQDTGRVWTEEQAQDQIDKFEEAYATMFEWKYDFVREYFEEKTPLFLPDGWPLWTDNDNKRSVGNFMVQGFSAALMKQADWMCHKEGLYVPFTLHDALYIYHKSDDLDAIDIAIRCMREGFQYFFDGEAKEIAGNIRIDPKTWGPDYKDGQQLITPNGVKIKASTIHIDERAISEYNKFSKYFGGSELDFL